jgi:hypothetical protein
MASDPTVFFPAFDKAGVSLPFIPPLLEGIRSAFIPKDRAAVVRELFRAPQSALHTLGDNGRALVAGKFTWPKVAVEMKSVYEWVLGRGPRPDCVQTKSCPVK